MKTSIGDVIVHVGMPADGNPYKGEGVNGPDRRAALEAFRDASSAADAFTYWHAPAMGGARQIRARSEIEWAGMARAIKITRTLAPMPADYYTSRPEIPAPDSADVDWRRNAHSYVATLHFETRTLETPFYTGTGWTETPSAVDILENLTIGADIAGEGFEEWCADFGYDIDSRRAYAQWEHAKRVNGELRAFFAGHPDLFEAVTTTSPEEWPAVIDTSREPIESESV